MRLLVDLYYSNKRVSVAQEKAVDPSKTIATYRLCHLTATHLIHDLLSHADS